MEKQEQNIILRFVPTMRCNYRCEYCFVENQIKENGITMFDDHPVEEWVDAMQLFKDKKIELYFWGGEPFSIDGTYRLLKKWTAMEHIVSGFRIDTNSSWAERIVKECPSDKIKLNCSFHMQYMSLREHYEKICLLKKYDMVGMVNFVASKYNMKKLRDEYGMTVQDLIEKYAEIGVFVNVAGDFAYANNPNYNRLEEYRDFIMQFISPEEWLWLRGRGGERLCSAGRKMFTVGHNGDFTSCISKKKYGNFFEGVLIPEENDLPCSEKCQSIISYAFRNDNLFPSDSSLLAYVERNAEYRKNRSSQYRDFFFDNEL